MPWTQEPALWRPPELGAETAGTEGQADRASHVPEVAPRKLTAEGAAGEPPGHADEPPAEPPAEPEEALPEQPHLSHKRSSLLSDGKKHTRKEMLELQKKETRLIKDGSVCKLGARGHLPQAPPGGLWMIAVHSSADENALALLAQYLRHYRALGIPAENFHFMIQSPTLKDAEIHAAACAMEALIRRHANGMVAHWEGTYSSAMMSELRHKMTDGLVRPRDWIVHADSDMFHEPRPAGLAWPEFLKAQARAGFNAVYGTYIDRVSADGRLTKVNSTGSIAAQYPLECKVTTKVIKATYKGTVGQKVMAMRGYLRPNRGGDVAVVPENEQNHLKISSAWIRSFHFKFTSSLMDRMETRLDTYKVMGYPWWRQSNSMIEHISSNGGICVDCKLLNCTRGLQW